MKYKIIKTIVGLMAAIFGALLYLLPALVGLLYDAIPHAWVLLVLLGVVGFSTYWHRFQRVAHEEERKFATSIDLDRLGATFGIQRKDGETDARYRARIREDMHGDH